MGLDPDRSGRRCRAELHQRADAVRPADLLRPVHRHRWAEQGRQGAHRRRECRTVEAMEIDGDHVVMGFSTGGNTIGTESRLAINTDTILGKKVLEIEPRGAQTLRPNGTLPLGQSTTPYQIYDAFFDVTKAAAGWDIDTVKQSLNVLSETIDQTYPHLSAALDGVAKFSDTIGKRDEQIKQLLAQANQVAGVLGDRSEQINRLFVNAQRRCWPRSTSAAGPSARCWATSSAFSTQVQGLINDNPEPQPRAGAAAQRQRPAGQAARTTWRRRSRRSASSPRRWPRPSRRGRTSRVSGQPAAVLDPAAVRRRRLQEARHRSGEVLAQRRVAGVPVPRPQRHAVPQRCAAAGAAGAGRHPGSSGPGGARRDRRARTRRRRNCCRGRATRCRVRASTRRGRSDRMGRIRPCPTWPPRRRTRRSAPDAGHPDRRAAGAGPTRRAGRTGAVAPGPPGGRTEPLGPLPGPAPGEPRRGTTASAAGPRTPGPAGTRHAACRRRTSATQVAPAAAVRKEVT